MEGEICQFYVAAALAMTFVDVSCGCSMTWVIAVGTEIRINGLEAVARAGYELCLAAVLAYFCLHAASSCTYVIGRSGS